MSDPTPAVLSVPIFLISIPFMIFYFSWGSKTTNQKAIRRKNCIWLLWLGLGFIVIECTPLFSITLAGDRLLGWVFTWVCGHGGPALIVSRNCVGLLRLIRDPATHWK